MHGEAALRCAIVMVGLVAANLPSAAMAADPTTGKAVFTSTCAICHSVQPGKNMTGPSLAGVVGRKTGTVPGFHYSPANQKVNLTWDEATLDKYLAVAPHDGSWDDNDVRRPQGRHEARRSYRLFGDA